MAATPQGTIDASTILAEVEALGTRIGRVRDAIGRVIFGQDEVVDQTLITLLSGGHVLLVGVPGLGKSRLVETLGIVLGLATKRVQFTPDLMPADIIGSEVLDEAEGRRGWLRARPGVRQLLMADEISRASPRPSLSCRRCRSSASRRGGTCAAKPFHVRDAGSIEQEGTYPLPRRNSTTSCSRSTSAIRRWRRSGPCCSRPRVGRGAAGTGDDGDELRAAQALIRRVAVGEKVWMRSLRWWRQPPESG
jgi:MoxR-like ATPase